MLSHTIDGIEFILRYYADTFPGCCGVCVIYDYEFDFDLPQNKSIEKYKSEVYSVFEEQLIEAAKGHSHILVADMVRPPVSNNLFMFEMVVEYCGWDVGKYVLNPKTGNPIFIAEKDIGIDVSKRYE